MRQQKEKGYLYFFLIIITMVTAFRLIYVAYGPLALAADEAHYWEWSRRLALSYYSKGPLVAYLIFISTKLGGATELMVRLPAVLLSLGSLLVLYFFSLELFSSHKVSFWAAFSVLVIPIFSAGSMLMTIDAPFVFLWLLAGWLSWRAVQASSGHYLWLALGAALGLGFLAKYTMLLFIPSLFMFLLVSGRQRRWLARKEPYLALVLALVLAGPVIFWNAAHGWVTVKHVMGQGGLYSGALISPKYFVRFFTSQLGVISPLLFIGLIWALVKAGHLGLRRGEESFLFLFWLSFPTLALFFLLSLHSNVQANWPAAAYPLALVALAALLALRPMEAKLVRKGFYLALGLALAMSAAGYYTDFLYRLKPDFKVRNDPTNRLRGWRELGRRVGEILQDGQSERMFIFSDRYQLASELAFYTPGNPRTYNVNLGRRLNQYDIWGGLSELQGSDGLFVRSGRDQLAPEVAAAFNECTSLQPLEVTRLGRTIRVFSFFRCRGFSGFPPGSGTPRY